VAKIYATININPADAINSSARVIIYYPGRCLFIVAFAPRTVNTLHLGASIPAWGTHPLLGYLQFASAQILYKLNQTNQGHSRVSEHKATSNTH